MYDDIITPQHKLSEAQGKLPTKIRQRTAAVDDASKLLKSGQFTPEEVSYFQGLPISVVKREQARLEEIDLARRRYLASGKLDSPYEQAHFTIYQR
jgi:hypothetical protein